MPTLHTERDGRVLIVRIENPPLNFMDRGMVGELDALTGSLRRDREVGAVVITGRPPGLYVTHYDIAEIHAGVSAVGVSPPAALAGGMLRAAGAVRRVPGLRRLAARGPTRGLFELRLIHDVFSRMGRLDKVFIAAINGPAGGGGCELSLACDLRYMADAEIRIGLPEMTLGFNPGAGGTQRLTRLLGSGRALEMMLEGAALTPREALAAGLVNRVVDPDRLLEEAVETGHRMSRRAPKAVAGLKRAVYCGATLPLERGLAVERKWFMTEAGERGPLTAMDVYAKELERSGEAGWSNPEAMRAWQQGTAADLVDGGDPAEGG